MRQLRVFQERRNDPEAEKNSPDVRGLEDEAVFRGSGVTVHLFVAPAMKAADGESLAQAYGLTLHEGTAVDGCTHFVSQWNVPGSHKKQALATFFAALDVRHRHPGTRVLLVESQGLREVLETRMPGHARELDVNDAAQDWVKTKSKFTLDAAVTHYLAQAGVNITASATRLELTDTQVREVTDSMQSTSTAPLRKVG